MAATGSHTDVEVLSGGVAQARGIRAAGVSAGIKTKAGESDVGLLVSDSEETAAAAVFTTNWIKAAPVMLSRKQLEHGPVRAVVVNSGNANACTGSQGMADAEAMVNAAASVLGLAPANLLVASTGIIGCPLPMDKVLSGIQAAAGQLGSGAEASEKFANAIMTTDSVMKQIAVRTEIGGVPVTVGGATKGAGMIEPNMATMLCFLTTDAAISPGTLQSCLSEAVGCSFNQITVDGHRSTNDTTAILATGLAGNERIEGDGAGRDAFSAALRHCCQFLAKAIVKDGEGATKFVEVNVLRAATLDAAKSIASAIANSPLVKTAIFGQDPNWGRIVSAAGYAGPYIDQQKVQLKIGEVTVFENGLPVASDPDKLAAVMKGEEIVIALDLQQGEQSTSVWFCDLTHEYVSINAEYHT